MLEAIFRQPPPATLRWDDIESLFLAYGAYVEERGGSRIAVEINGTVGYFHRPHPRKEAHRKAVIAVRDFLVRAGIASQGEEKRR